jgi:alkyl sulfatase BDS1-like metallo-beta-lactamase superfamily hydrolase
LDHYGGIRAILDNAPNTDSIKIIASKGFFESASDENLLAGPAMQRRALYMYGMLLPMNELGNIGSGLGQTNATGPRNQPVPTVEIDFTNEKDHSIDGLKIEYIYATDVEAPNEIMMYFPEYKSFCVAELINPLLHNLITLRGAKVRNGQLWSKAIDRALQLCGAEVESSFSTHNWPVWGNENIVKYWEGQRDMYRFIHDQTLRLANVGYTPVEIAEMLELPETLAHSFQYRDYYGTVSHNVKAQYQLYYGWYDGNPANLHALPPVEAGKKYVEAMGGAAAVINIAQKAYNEGDYRWGAMLLNHLVFANPDNQNARNLLANIYTQLGYQAESGPWRNFYLTGAAELRNKPNPDVVINLIKPKPADFLANLNGMKPEVLFDYLGVKIDGKQAAKENLAFNIQFNDKEVTTHTLILNNGALTNRSGNANSGCQCYDNRQKNRFHSAPCSAG